MKPIWNLLAALGMLSLGGAALAAEEKPDLGARWEYRVLTKDQVLDLGKKDLAAGLNKLGDEGWELAAVDAAYIFKRPRGGSRKLAADLRRQIAWAEADVERLKDRVSWSERMVQKGYLTYQRVEAEKADLKRAETFLNEARKELEALPAEPKER
jgi:hypothetical protein